MFKTKYSARGTIVIEPEPVDEQCGGVGHDREDDMERRAKKLVAEVMGNGAIETIVVTLAEKPAASGSKADGDGLDKYMKQGMNPELLPREGSDNGVTEPAAKVAKVSEEPQNDDTQTADTTTTMRWRMKAPEED